MIIITIMMTIIIIMIMIMICIIGMRDVNYHNKKEFD